MRPYNKKIPNCLCFRNKSSQIKLPFVLFSLKCYGQFRCVIKIKHRSGGGSGVIPGVTFSGQNCIKYPRKCNNSVILKDKNSKKIHNLHMATTNLNPQL